MRYVISYIWYQKTWLVLAVTQFRKHMSKTIVMYFKLIIILDEQLWHSSYNCHGCNIKWSIINTDLQSLMNCLIGVSFSCAEWHIHIHDWWTMNMLIITQLLFHDLNKINNSVVWSLFNWLVGVPFSLKIYSTSDAPAYYALESPDHKFSVQKHHHQYLH